jgi:two-component system nitrogen regulation sensor histidine kinase GlnL
MEEIKNIVLNNLNVSVLLLDERLKILYANSATESLFDTSSFRVVGKSILNFLKEYDGDLQSSQIDFSAIDKAMNDYRPFTQRELCLQLSDDVNITVDFTVSPIIHGSKKMLLLEIQQVERLIQLNKEQGFLDTHKSARNLIRDLAHEIKNPLGGIKGAAQLLSDDLENRQELLEFTSIISKETDRLSKLVDQMLGSNTLPKFTLLNIHEVIEYVVSLIEKETMGNISINKVYDPSIPEISGDKGKLTQAFLNVMLNSVQALSDNKTANPVIEVTTSIERNQTIRGVHHKMSCCIQIVDNGPGVSEEMLDLMFFPSITGKVGGTGLGLSISQSAIDVHHGLIKCENKSGKTFFYIYLPLDK